MASKSVEMTIAENGVKGKVVKYESKAPDALIGNVYVSKGFANPMPQKITITISDGGEGEGKRGKNAS